MKPYTANCLAAVFVLVLAAGVRGQDGGKAAAPPAFVPAPTPIATADHTVAVAPREQFKVPLAKVNIAFDNTRKKYNQVKIYFGDDDGYTVIAPGDDMLVKKNGETIVHRELPQVTYLLSDFEAKTINQVCRTLVATLEEYETIIKDKNWGRALYLDAYFPRFLRGFHTLICAAKDSQEALPQSALVRDEDYDVSLNSPKSDARIKMWQTDKDRIMKLRISTQELILQTKKWQSSELTNSKRNPELSYSGEFDRAFTSFVRNYFGYVP
ncbi:MAG: hypothetical protein LBB74_07220 [Chitinispirillales bacterium]|nr:hypothetical protein [Chitinispirillales bacterium]